MHFGRQIVFNHRRMQVTIKPAAAASARRAAVRDRGGRQEAGGGRREAMEG